MTVLTFDGFYTVDLVRAHPDKIFIFGDNTQGVGRGGQAIIRDEPNVWGIPTKWAPTNDAAAFFRSGDARAIGAVYASLVVAQGHLSEGRRLVWPVTAEGHSSLGLGLARLNEKAPGIYALLAAHLEGLSPERFVA